jgi:hypothetical protein
VRSKSRGGYALEKVVWLVWCACLWRTRIVGDEGIAVDIGIKESPCDVSTALYRDRGPYFRPCKQCTSVGAPSKREGFPANIQFCDCSFRPRIPEPDSAIPGAARKFEFSHRIERDLLNSMPMSLQLSLTPWAVPFGIPYSDGFVICASCDQASRSIP